MPNPKTWYTITNEADTAIVNIHGNIGGWDITAASLIDQVNAMDSVNNIQVHINSYGGEVFEGIAIYNFLRNHKATVETVIDSVAASIASVIFMAGDKRSAYQTSMGMVHDPIMWSFGNSEQLRKDADLLDKIDKTTIKKAYRRGIGEKMSDDEIAALMDDETWMDADEMVEFGFATDIIDSEEDKGTEDRWKAAAEGLDFEKLGFKRVPQAIFNLFHGNRVVNKPQDSVPVKPENSQPNKEGNVPTPEELKKAEDAAALAQKNAVDAALVAERERAKLIRDTATQMGLPSEKAESLVDSGATVQDAVKELNAAKALMVDAPAGGTSAIDQSITVSADEREKYRKGAVLSLCMASGMPVTAEEKSEAMKDDLPRGLHGLVKQELRREGRVSNNAIDNLTASDIGSHALRLAQNAVGTGTGDLTNILADALNKGISIGYEQAPSTWQAWVRVVPVTDFKTYNLAKLSAFSDMDVIPEGAPFKQGAISDSKETGTMTVKGKALNVSWQTFVNDDKAALSRIPQIIGGSYSFRQNKDVYDALYGSDGTGPTMNEDSVALFDSTHSNYVTAGAAPSISTLQTARTAMRNQIAPKGEASDADRPLNLVPMFIIHGTSLEGTTEQLLLSAYDVTNAGSLAYNAFKQGARTPLTMIVDAYYETLNQYGWYLAASPSQIETVQLLALDGQVMPTIRSENSRVGEALGVNWDVFGAYGVMVGDYRGLYYNDGVN